MRNFEEIVKMGAERRREEETGILGSMGHEANEFNGVFSVGRLSVIATTETTAKEIVECVSISKNGAKKKPEAEEVELVKNLFWYKEELEAVSRLYIPSNIIHLHKTVLQN